MQEPVVFTEFLVRRITQLWAQAAGLPERSPAQAPIERLACALSDYMSSLNPRASQSKKRKAPKPMKRHCGPNNAPSDYESDYPRDERAVPDRNATIASRRPGKLGPANRLVSPRPQRRNTRRDQDRAANLPGEDS